MQKTSIFLTLCLVLFAGHITAADYYVAKTGDDTNAGTEASPFLTIGKAAAVAEAGDVVYIFSGSYEETLRPANSGSQGSPITFRSVEGERVILTAMQALTGFAADAGDIYQVSVDWDLGQENFVMNGSTAMDLARWPDNTDGDPFTLNERRNDGGSPGATEMNAFLTDSDIPNFDWTGGSLLFYGDRPGSGWTTWKAFSNLAPLAVSISISSRIRNGFGPFTRRQMVEITSWKASRTY